MENKKKELTYEEIISLIKLNESSNLEFKEKLDLKKLKIEVTSFLNFFGGTILVGVNDFGKVLGIKIENENKIISDLQQSFNSINPKPLNLINIYIKKNLIVIDVLKGDKKYYLCDGVCYIREGKNTQKLVNPNDINRFFNLKNQKNFDEELNKEFNFENGFYLNSFIKYVNKSNIEESLKDINNNPKKILESRNFMKNGVFNNCGILFFCENIEKFFLNCSCDCILYKGNNKIEILDRKTLKEDIITNIENSLIYLKQKLNLSYEIKSLRREEILEIPEVALREILLNAFGHRDYNETSNIFIEIYEDRIEITNPGKFNIELSEIEKSPSIPRNNLLFSKFLDMNLVEKVGSGFRRIRESLESKNLKYKIESGSKWFKFIIYRKSKLSFLNE